MFNKCLGMTAFSIKNRFRGGKKENVLAEELRLKLDLEVTSSLWASVSKSVN